MLSSTSIHNGARIIGILFAGVGVICLMLSPLIGKALFATLWGIEPLVYIGVALVMGGLAAISLSYFIRGLMARKSHSNAEDGDSQRWSQVTQQYFELFDHDLGRPMRRILGKERQLRAVLERSGASPDPAVIEFLYEIERQVPNFRLMMSNIQVMVQFEAARSPGQLQPVEPAEVIRKSGSTRQRKRPDKLDAD